MGDECVGNVTSASMKCDEGSIAVASLGSTIMLTSLALVGVMVGQIAWARAQVASTADLAALAAVAHGCDGGESVALKNDAQMVSCDWSDSAVTVQVERNAHVLPIVGFLSAHTLRGSATAVLVPSTSTSSTSTPLTP